MSLKAFHIIFVLFAGLLAVGFGGWAVREFRLTGDASALVAGVGSLLFALVLVGYGRWFLRKLKGVSYL